MIRALRRQFKAQPQPRRRRLYLLLSFGFVVWLGGFCSLVAGTFWPGRPLVARIFSGVCVLIVVGVTGAFAFVIARLERSGVFDQDAPWT